MLLRVAFPQSSRGPKASAIAAAFVGPRPRKQVCIGRYALGAVTTQTFGLSGLIPSGVIPAIASTCGVFMHHHIPTVGQGVQAKNETFFTACEDRAKRCSSLIRTLSNETPNFRRASRRVFRPGRLRIRTLAVSAASACNQVRSTARPQTGRIGARSSAKLRHRIRSR